MYKRIKISILQTQTKEKRIGLTPPHTNWSPGLLGVLRRPAPLKLQRGFFTKCLASGLRVGPHRKEIIDTLVGSLLGDSWGEKRGDAVRFHLHYSSKNVEYLEHLQQFFARNGYCSSEKVKKTKQIGKGGKLYYSLKIRTYSFKSFQYLYNAFYTEGKRKVVPREVSKWLSAKGLAIWIMDNGGVSNQGFKLSTESFTREELDLLKEGLLDNFGLCFTVQKHKDKWILYLSKKQQTLLTEIVKPFMLPCMYYKIRLS